MKLFLSLILSLFISTASYSATDSLNQEGPSVDWNLKLGDQVRFFVTDSPSFGHLSNTINSIFHLRESQYEGRIELVYRSERILEKVKTLITEYDIKKLKIQMLPFSSLDKNSSKTKFAFFGGYDSTEVYFKTYSQYTIVLQPYQWKVPSLIIKNYSNRLLSEIYSNYSAQVLDFRESTIPSILTSMEDITSDNSLDINLRSIILQTLGNKKSYLSALIYGLEPIGDQSKIVRLEKLKKLLILYSDLYKFRNENKALTLFLSNSYAREDIITTLGQLELRGYDFEYDGLEKKIDRSEKISPIRIVDIGPVPIKVFNYLFQTSDYPVSLFGANSLQMAVRWNKAFIPTDNIVINRLQSSYPELLELFDWTKSYFPQYRDNYFNNRVPREIVDSRVSMNVLNFYSDWINDNSTNKIKFPRLFSDSPSDKMEKLIDAVENRNKIPVCKRIFHKLTRSFDL